MTKEKLKQEISSIIKIDITIDDINKIKTILMGNIKKEN